MNIYVGNISFTLSEEELQETFAEFGQVKSCKIIMDRETGRPKGFGFVEMNSEDEGKAAIEGLDGVEVSGRPLQVNVARPRQPRS
ncbi:MAG: RNA-binding protein [SAR324 cluster bacterium]|nr:RNA-binding protein [SAR324 cluster bacterium]